MPEATKTAPRGAPHPEKARVEPPYLDGCPTHPEAGRDLRAVLEDLAEEGGNAEILPGVADTVGEAQGLRLPASPTICLDGHDPSPVPGRWGPACRSYPTPQGPKGVPTSRMLRAEGVLPGFLDGRRKEGEG